MNKTIRAFCNFFVIIIIVISLTYISFFTDIPTKTGNLVRLKMEEIKNKYYDYNSEFYINELGIRMNTYYYDKLTSSQQKIYSSIANAVKNFETEFAVRDYVATDTESFASEVAAAIEAFINDHPEVFYLRSQYSSYILSNFNGNIGYVKLNYTEENIDNVNTKLSLMKEKITKIVDEFSNLSEYEKEVAIHDKLANEITYSNDEELPRAYHTAEGTLLEGIGVCDGFTKSLQLIYNMAGIDSIIVLGTLDNNPHAWNLVKLDDEWYNVDITSSRSIYDDTGIINHAYFNLTHENMDKIADFDKIELLPEANSLKYNFYNYNNYIVDDTQDIHQQLVDICNIYQGKPYIEFYLKGNVANTISSILVSLKKIDDTFLTGTKMYYYNIENAIIIPKN